MCIRDRDGEDAAEENMEEGHSTEEGNSAEKVVYYVTDEQQQGQYIKMFRDNKMDAVILTHNIDQPFIQQLESKNEGVKFQRIDADVTNALKDEISEETEKELE